VILGDYQLASFRNQPGEDPDMNYIWWYGDSNPVNFGRFNDPVINENLDRGRSDPDEDARRKAYEAINEQFAGGLERVAVARALGGRRGRQRARDARAGPPGQGGPPSGRLVTGHSLLGIWIEDA
jgi:peptide/nickel transport system substrate-binding protein